MLRIDRNGKKLVKLQRSALAEADHWERDLQAMILAAPDEFCEEIGESLWLIGQEVRPSEAVADRIDILAIDEDANSVVVELKRGTNKLQLLQAVSYAGMISHWSRDQFVETLARNFSVSNKDALSEIEAHTEPNTSALNRAQRIILIAENFDPALLIAAEWLHEKFNVDIRCYRMQLSREEGGNDYLTCALIYPPQEIATLTRGSDGRAGRTSIPWESWDAALEDVQNAALIEYVRSELARKQEDRLSQRQIIYRVRGKRRFYLNCKINFGNVWQEGRFKGDMAYWKGKVSAPDDVEPKARGRVLRFYLRTAADFAAFGKAMRDDLANAEFIEPDDDDEPRLDQL